MIGKISSVCLMAIVGGGYISADSLDSFISHLDSISPFHSRAEYRVTLPSMPDDIIYTVDLQSTANGSDPLSPCDYLIQWSLPTPSGTSEGFSAYSDGSHYRYHDERLQEYHYDWDSIPFLSGRGGVQRNAQFTDLLPQYIALQLRAIAADPGYAHTFHPDTVVNNRPSIAIDGMEIRNGYTARKFTYIFDSETARPSKIEFDNNPGSISEQSVSVTFTAPNLPAAGSFSEENLISLFPEQFGRFRQCNFRIENLAGTFLPSFSLPTPTGERYSRQRGDSFRAPTLIAIIDPAVSTAAETVAEIRRAAQVLPFGLDLIYAFVSGDADLIDEVIPALMPGETILMSARSLARDCGVTSFPTLIFAGRDGKVGDTHLGFNKLLSDIVIQKATLLNSRH